MSRRLHTTITAVAATCAALALTAACSTGGAEPTGPPVTDDVVRTGEGLVQGTVSDGHRRFAGIPYAAPPVGDLRWRAPRSPTPWDGVRDATRPGAPCPQAWQNGSDGQPDVQGNEDCLFLNVDTPAADGPLPVMVFLHGGGFTSGQGTPYDPARVTDQGQVVVVTVNYRLGALGFLDHPVLQDEAAGNYGLADQQAALRWVQQNIAAFGGDPGNVTLWGESAGAFSVCAQLGSPSARGLFHKAIVQSGPCSNAMQTHEVAGRRSLDAAAEAGCPDPAIAAACLRALPANTLVSSTYPEDVTALRRHIADMPWLPVAGTAALPQQPIEAIRSGAAADVPLIHGGTRDEMRAWIAQLHDAAGQPVTAESYPQIVRDYYGAGPAERILAAYPVTDYPSPSVALATVIGDEGRLAGSCAQFEVLEAATSPVYAYEFDAPVPDIVGSVPLGTSHGADVPYFFDSGFPGAPPPSRTPAETALADRLIDWWTTFADTGRPGSDWPAYADGGVMAIGNDGIAPRDVARDHRCDLWRAVPA